MSRTSRTRYQRPGGGGDLRVEPPYSAPPEGSDLRTTDDDTADVQTPEVLPEPAHVGLGEAVPVRVVNFSRELDRIRQVVLYSYSVGPDQRIVIPGRRNRLRIVVRSVTTDGSVRVSHESGQRNGFLLVTGQPDLEGTHQGPLYVWNPDDTDTFDVSVVEETVVELQ